jgi:opacity protein-like surface antigen
MTSPIRSSLLLAAACSGAGLPAAAQSLQKLSVQGSGAVLFATTKDPDFVSRTRLGYEAQIRYTYSRLSVGVGYQRSTVFAFPDNALRLDLSQGFIEPRFVLVTRNVVAVYAAGRVGLGKIVCGDQCAANQTNATFGGGGGLLFRLTRRLSADLGGQFFHVSGSVSQGFVMARAGLGLGL